MPEIEQWESGSVYRFVTDSMEYATIETKSGQRHYVEGYISTDDIDLDNEVVTKSAMYSIVKQLKSNSIKLDYEHEAFRDSSSILPVGRIIDARVENNKVWAKAELNPDSPKFKSLWGSIKKGFVDAFSIAFKKIDVIKKSINGKVVTLINDLRLLNVAFTGVPVNTNARITSVFTKALQDYEVNKMDADELKQQEETLKAKEDELKERENTLKSREEELARKEAALKSEEEKDDEQAGADKEEEKDEEEEEEKEKDEENVAVKAMKKLAEHEKAMKELKSREEELAKEFKAFKEQPVLKSMLEEPSEKSQPEKITGMLDLI